MLTSVSLHELLESRRKELGLSHMQLGVKAFGREDASTLHNIKRGSSPTYERLAQIVEAMGWEILIGPARQTGFSEPEHPTNLTAANGLRANYLPIPWLDATTSKGSSPIALHANYLDQLGLQVDRLRAFVPDVLRAGAGHIKGHVAVIDPLATRRGMGLWAYRSVGKTTISMVSFEPPSAIILSEPLSEPPMLISDISIGDVAFLGRVELIVKPA